MNILESPLEALAFNYVSFGFFTVVNNLWTWIAVVTAAVSFWRIRFSGGGEFTVEASSPVIDDRSSIKLDPPTSEPAEAAEEPSPIPSPPIPSRLDEGIAMTRGARKFALYYCDEDRTDGGKVAATEEVDGGELTAAAEWFESWERVLKTRRGESWYSWQDLGELNGNVVRFWDGRDCRERSRQNWYPKRCVSW